MKWGGQRNIEEEGTSQILARPRCPEVSDPRTVSEALGPVGGRRAKLEAAGLSAAGPLDSSCRRTTARPCWNLTATPKLLPPSQAVCVWMGELEFAALLQSTGWSFVFGCSPEINASTHWAGLLVIHKLCSALLASSPLVSPPAPNLLTAGNSHS